MADNMNNNQTITADSPLPQANINVTGGAGGTGGQAITLSYSNNYSSLLMMYTYLLNLANSNGAAAGEGINLLLPILQEAMEDEKKYREAFLTAVQSLSKQ